MKIRPVGTELFRAEGRTDGQKDRWPDRYDETNRRFSQFCEKRLKLYSLMYKIKKRN